MEKDDFKGKLKRSLYTITFVTSLAPWITEIVQIYPDFLTWGRFLKCTILSSLIIGLGLLCSNVALTILQKHEQFKRAVGREQLELTYIKKLTENLVNGMGMNIELIGSDYTILFANRELKEMFGDVEGKKCYEAYMQRSTPCENCPATKALKEGVPRREIIYLDGRIYEFICVPFENSIIGSMRDITEKRRLEEEIEIEKDKLNTILMSMGDGVAIVDKDFKITYSNRRLHEILGKEIIGKKCYEVYQNLKAPCEGCPINFEKLEKGYIDTLEMKTNGKSLLVTYSPIKNFDGSYSIIQIVKDITELRQLDEIKETLITNVSHELKTPLTVAKGMVDLIMDEPLTDELKEGLGVIRRNLERLHKLIEDLIEIAKMKRKCPLALEENDIRNEIKRAVKELENYAENRKVKVILQLPEEPILLKSDRYKLYQVFYHLINNGIKFNREGGTVIVQAKNNEKFVEIAIEDTGVGIPKEHLDKIFDKFYQVEMGINRRFSGMGIGLAMAKEIVKLHGGEIFVESEVGKGSKFTLIFPIS